MGFRVQGLGRIEQTTTHRLLSSSFLGLPYRILNANHKKELLRSLWVISPPRDMSLKITARSQYQLDGRHSTSQPTPGQKGLMPQQDMGLGGCTEPTILQAAPRSPPKTDYHSQRLTVHLEISSDGSCTVPEISPERKLSPVFAAVQTSTQHKL